MRYAVSLSSEYVVLYGDLTAIAVVLLPVVYKSHINNSLRTSSISSDVIKTDNPKFFGVSLRDSW